MKISKLKIKNLFGITEFEADEKSIELMGANGTGKTSVLDSIRLALTNKTDRDFTVKNGEYRHCRNGYIYAGSIELFRNKIRRCESKIGTYGICKHA